MQGCWAQSAQQHGPSKAQLGSRDLAWTANQDLLLVSCSDIIQYFLWKSRSVFAQTDSCLLQRKTPYVFYLPLFIYKGDPDHQLLFIMEKNPRLRLTGQQALDKKG